MRHKGEKLYPVRTSEKKLSYPQAKNAPKSSAPYVFSTVAPIIGCFKWRGRGEWVEAGARKTFVKIYRPTTDRRTYGASCLSTKRCFELLFSESSLKLYLLSAGADLTIELIICTFR